MTRISTENATQKKPVSTFFCMLARDFSRNKLLYLMVLPVVAYYIIFAYWPMYGIQIAFKDFSFGKGYLGSPWVGFKHFEAFFNSFYFPRVMRNTLIISFLQLVFMFPTPIIFALMINEVRNRLFKKWVQTISYLPYFISLVVIIGIINEFCVSDGLINDIVAFFGGERTSLLQSSANFRTIYIASGLWSHLGWSSIIFIAAISTIDPELYQSAIIDGAGRFRQVWHITLPGIRPTIVILLILSLGSFLNVGFEKIILLYNPATYEVGEVISSYVYSKGLQNMKWSFGAAVGLFNSVINLILLISANKISKKISEISLW